MKRLTKWFAALLSAAILFPCIGNYRVNAADDLGVPLDEKHFPDSRFRAILASRTYNKDGDNYLNDYELERLRNLHCENSKIESLEGVEYLKYTIGIWCRDNQITQLDLSQNTALTGVWCSGNPISTLDFSGNPNLQWVYCYDCKLTSLNVSNNPELGYLECNTNPDLKTIDLKSNDKLEHLFISDSGLTELDLSGCPRITHVTCHHNHLKKLILTNNTKLKRLDCWFNKELTYIDVSGLKELEYFNCAYNNMKTIDVTHNPNLMELVCGDNLFTELDLSKNPRLAYLAVGCDTKLKKLDISHNPKLYYLLAYGLSSIDSIDISKNSRLCDAYHRGVYKHEDHIGRVYSMEINYGGSEDTFDQLRHCVAFDDRMPIIADYNGTNDVPDCYIDTNDGLADTERFATRQEAMWLLYEMAGRPQVNGAPSFKDVDPNSPYADAIKWGQDNRICFGYPRICDENFCGEELINREDFALMAHRYAGILKLGTALDYGRTDWLDDFLDIDFYGWAAFTWAIQFKVLAKKDNDTKCYPHGRMTWQEVQDGAYWIFHLDEAASYADRVADGKTWAPPASVAPATPSSSMPPTVAPKNPSKPGSSNPSTPTNPGTSNNPGTTNPSTTNKPGTISMTDPSNNSSTSNNTTKPSSSSNQSSKAPAITKAVITQAPDPKSSVADFVDRIYKYVLDRESEAEGAAFWTDELYCFRRTGAEVGLQFIFSDEFVSRNLSDAEFVTVLYRTFFGREPEQDGFKYWTSALADGTFDRIAVANGFVYSQEWADTCARYGIRSGGIEPMVELTPSDKTYAFVERMYTTALKRESDKDGKNYWSAELANFRYSGEQVGVLFFLSDEMNALGLNDSEFVTRLYKTFMDRDPEEGGFNFWVGYLAGGGSRDGAVLGFTRSEEFVNKCIEARILPY